MILFWIINFCRSLLQLEVFTKRPNGPISHYACFMSRSSITYFQKIWDFFERIEKCLKFPYEHAQKIQTKKYANFKRLVLNPYKILCFDTMVWLWRNNTKNDEVYWINVNELTLFYLSSEKSRTHVSFKWQMF